MDKPKYKVSPSSLKLEVIGPYGLIGENNVFHSKEKDLCGAYIFSVKIGNSYLIEYIGITKRSYFTRFNEHVREILSGGYKIYDNNKFLQGKRIAIWNGRFGKNAEKDILKFLEKYNELSPKIIKQLKAYSIFFIPLGGERISERVEAAFYQMLKDSKDKIAQNFVDHEVIYRIRKKDEKPIKIKFNKKHNFLGISREFEI